MFRDYLKRWNNGIADGAPQRLAKKLKINPGTVSRWLSTGKPPKEDSRQRVADELGISLMELMSCFNEKGAHTLSQIADPLPVRFSDVHPVPGISVREVYYFGEVSASKPNLPFDAIPLSSENLYMAVPNGARLGIFKIMGDCMDDNSPEGLHPGDKVLVSEQSHAEPGDIIIALVDNELTIKELKHIDGNVVLQPRNPKHKPIIVKGEFRILGVVLRSFHDFKKR